MLASSDSVREQWDAQENHGTRLEDFEKELEAITKFRREVEEAKKAVTS